jgi:hypothetical protein
MTLPHSSFFTEAILVLLISHGTLAFAQIDDESMGGKVSGRFNLRYESVRQDNALKDAQALTLSSRLSYTTGEIEGFSAMVEVEDVRIIGGVDKYAVGPSGFNLGEYSVIADPETTELDQGFLQYKDDRFTAKLGRQVIVYDNHRFIGHVGWRQDRQTFDALSIGLTPIENLSLNYNYLDERQRIFAQDADIDSNDHLFHANYTTSVGTLTGYAYLLEVASSIDNSLDTYGLRLSGFKELAGLTTSYLVEYASQKLKAGTVEFDADYFLLEGGLTINGISARLGYEVLGSDNGAYGFSTPLSTLHAHNGWADSFLGTPAQGLVDTYLNLGGNALGGSWSIIYHHFETDKSTAAVEDFGKELDMQFIYPISENYSLGVKYGIYSAVDVASSESDTDKLWAWFGVSF